MLENHRFSNDFTGNRTELIRLNSLNIGRENLSVTHHLYIISKLDLSLTLSFVTPKKQMG